MLFKYNIFYLFRFILLFSLTFTSSFASSLPYKINLSDEQVSELGLLIWKNEGQNKLQHLTVWNKGENFPSLGLGHFIWYPENEKGPFKEQFPALLDFFKTNNIVLPDWLDHAQLAPWKSRQQFYQEFDQKKLVDLRVFLSKHLDIQVKFIILRLENAIPKILASSSSLERQKIQINLQRLTATSAGLFTLLDYINFKGEGISEKERYQGQGWGLKQVLLTMPDTYIDPLRAFGLSADEVLTRRVKNAPRDEMRWLQGWRNRIYGYQYIPVVTQEKN